MTSLANRIGYVFVGGFLGTLARYFISESIGYANPGEFGELTWLYTVNLLGAFFFGITAKHPRFSSENCRNLWGVGFAGGFTTMSAVTTYVDFYGFPSVWVGLMMLLGMGAYAAGYRLGRLAKKRSQNG